MVRGFEIPQYSFIFNYNLMEVLYSIVYSLFWVKKKKRFLHKQSRRYKNENQFEEKPTLNW